MTIKPLQVVSALWLAVLPGVAFCENSMIGNFRSLFSPFFQSKPTPPEPFGYKMGWIAVRSTDLKAVADSLPLGSQTPASWHDGIEAAYSGAYNGGMVFITPPINGWICLVGNWAMGAGERHSIDSVAKIGAVVGVVQIEILRDLISMIPSAGE